MDEKAGWSRVEEIFDRAMELDGDERRAYIRYACKDDPELRREVDDLLRAAEESESYLDRPVGLAYDVEVSGALGQISRAPSPVGRTIGPYRIVEAIGQGGMGRIFRAERADGAFQQQVAIKLLRWELAGGSAEDRFRSERQFLATLEHPGIARLLDGGVTEEGLPYLVMELVAGEPLDAYCQERELSLEDRLWVFMRVCAVVHFAHRKLVVHRDLKPSNILVTPDGEVKLLDFGIAKLLDDESGGVTRDLARGPLTPSYASPEQILGEPVSTATDVYALGAILYQILTGRRPHEPDLPTAPELARRITTDDPDPPSHAVISDAAGVPTPRWAHGLRGDLDSITLKALHRDPDGRYASAEALADDVARFLAHKPVRARRGARGYVARRFVRRHRVGIAGTVAVLAAITAGIYGTVSQARRAVAEARRAESVSAMILSLFEFTDPFRDPQRNELRAEDLLDRGLEVAERELVSDPVTLAQMLLWIGSGYDRVGARDKARPVLERAVAINREEREAPALAESLHRLGVLANGQYRYEAAEGYFNEELRIRAELGQSTTAEFGWALAASATAISGHDANLALARVDSARALVLGQLAPDDPRILNLEVSRARILGTTGDLPASEAAYEELLTRWEDAYPVGHPDMASPLNNLASVRRRQGDLVGAVDAYSRALALLERFAGDAHPTTILVRTNLSSALGEGGNHERALALLQRNVDAIREEFPDRKAEIARRSSTIGNAWLVWGDPTRAVTAFEEALRLYAEAGPGEELDIALARTNLAASLHLSGDHARAEGEWEAATRYLLRAGAGGLNASGTAELNWLANQYERYGQPHQAERVRALVSALGPYRPAESERDPTPAPLPPSPTPDDM